MDRPISCIVIGAGSRGRGYAGYATLHPDRARVVGVAEPCEPARRLLAEQHCIPAANVHVDWREVAARGKLADAVVITTQDAMHTEPAIAFAALGYHILLEKPMAPSEDECARIVAAVKAAGVLLAVGHVLLYTPYTRALKQQLDQGAVGDVVSIQHLEPVGYWHQAHSYVRGSWRREADATFMLMAKSCHDMDWIRHVMGRRCEAVSSFGSLTHFRRAQKPAEAGAATRCLDCSHEPHCPYSARKLYLGMLERGELTWPLTVVSFGLDRDSVTRALRCGRYGRCVYECDNDVVDHQVVNLQFEGGRTASFTMTAFTPIAGRQTRIFGTRGQIEGDGSVIRVTDFLTDTTTVIDTQASAASLAGEHGGGDHGLMGAFVEAVRSGDPGRLLSGPDETLESHRMVFAAERARREQRVVRL